MTIEIKGWISEGICGDVDDALYVGDDLLASKLEDLSGATVSVRYWICNEEITKDQATEEFLYFLLGGELQSEFTPHYTEITGYIGVTEELYIGGHDLLQDGNW
jgi:hypothetical protein